MREFVRALPVDVEVTGRIVEGIALRWDHPYRVSDDNGATFYAEGWRAGAFARGLQAMGNFHEVRVDHHDVRTGRCTFHETDEGLPFVAVLDETPEGDAALEYARAGRFRGVSLRYQSDSQRLGADGVVWRTRGWPRELSFIDGLRPQYGNDAVITGVRGIDDGVVSDDDLARTTALAALLDRSTRNLAIELPAVEG